MHQEGDEVGGYLVESVLAEGDLGPTYKVTKDDETFALRVLEHSDQGFQERLRRAGEAQKAVQHPNVVRVAEVIETPHGPAVVTEYVDGGDLEAWIARGPHPIDQTLEVFAGLLRGLEASHAAGILHRNLKPAKVLMTAEGQAKVNDFVFGRVDAGDNPRLTAMDHTFGTPQFMAPEQFHGAAKVNERADLFSAGCILYEMLSATRAFPGVNIMEIYLAVSDGDYIPLAEAREEVPPGVVAFQQALMAIKPEERTPSATAALEALAAIDLDAAPAPPAAEPKADSLPPPPPEPDPSPDDDAEFEAMLAANARRRQAAPLFACGCVALLLAVLSFLGCAGWAYTSWFG